MICHWKWTCSISFWDSAEITRIQWFCEQWNWPRLSQWDKNTELEEIRLIVLKMLYQSKTISESIHRAQHLFTKKTIYLCKPLIQKGLTPTLMVSEPDRFMVSFVFVVSFCVCFILCVFQSFVSHSREITQWEICV